MAVGRWRRSLELRAPAAGFLVAMLVLALMYLPGPLTFGGPARGEDPLLPSTIARYSWYTGMLSHDRFEAASLLYQNGVGVEFMDTPQSVLLSTDGSTYRRLDEAESGSIPEDQGDPAVSVLSPDGTFVVVGSAGRTGEVQVVTLSDGHRRSVSVGSGRTALPVSIGADNRTVLITTSKGVVNRYAETNDLGLARLDLQTGQVLEYPQIQGAKAAALSPDGSRIVVTSVRGAELVDAATGRVMATVVGSRELSLDGDAWSPDGRLVALTEQSTLFVVDVSGPKPVQRRPRLLGMEYASAIGWRNPATVLVHGTTNGHKNTSEMYWVDATTGTQESFASYTPNFTGAALLGADAARNLVTHWQVSERPIDRGPLPLPLGILLAVFTGLGAAAIASIFSWRARR